MNQEINLSDWAHLLVILPYESGPLSGPSKEMLGKGRELADQLGVWLTAYTTHPLSDRGKEIVSYGADRIFENAPKELIERPEAERLIERPEAERLIQQTDLLAGVIEKHRPEIVLFPSSSEMIPLAARVAQRFGTGLATDCVALSLDLTERKLLATRPLYDGKLLEEVHWPGRRPQMAMLRPGAFPEGFSDPTREGTIERISMEVS